jgi:hypothetical protein
MLSSNDHPGAPGTMPCWRVGRRMLRGSRGQESSAMSGRGRRPDVEAGRRLTPPRPLGCPRAGPLLPHAPVPIVGVAGTRSGDVSSRAAPPAVLGTGSFLTHAPGWGFLHRSASRPDVGTKGRGPSSPVQGAAPPKACGRRVQPRRQAEVPTIRGATTPASAAEAPPSPSGLVNAVKHLARVHDPVGRPGSGASRNGARQRQA